jgi:hypothetical protein
MGDQSKYNGGSDPRIGRAENDIQSLSADVRAIDEKLDAMRESSLKAHGEVMRIIGDLIERLPAPRSKTALVKGKKK